MRNALICFQFIGNAGCYGKMDVVSLLLTADDLSCSFNYTCEHIEKSKLSNVPDANLQNWIIEHTGLHDKTLLSEHMNVST